MGAHMPDSLNHDHAGAAAVPPRRDGPSLGRLFWPALLAGAVFLASSRPRLATPVEFSHMDKVVHALTFGLMATLLVRVFFRPRHPVRSALVAIACASLFGITDEFHQSYTPGRTVDVGDWIADTGGAMLAVTLYTLWPWYRRVLEWRPGERGG
jgi:VanZ family protein